MVDRDGDNIETDYLLDALLALREELRGAGFDPGLQRIITAQRLLFRLAREGRLPKLRSDWRDWLAPVFCGSKEQQAEFDLRFPAWVKRYKLDDNTESEPSISGSAEGEAEIPGDTGRRSVHWWGRFDFSPKLRFHIPTILILLVVGVLTVSMTLWWRASRPQGSNEVIPDPQTSAKLIETGETIEVTGQPKLLPTPPANPTPPPPGGLPLPPRVNPMLVWWQKLLIAIPLLIWLVWQILTWLLRKAWLKRLPSRRLPRLEQLQVEGADHRLFATMRERRLLVEFRRPQAGMLLDLDIPETVRETARSVGLFSPSFGNRRQTPEYLYLIDREGLRDEQARVADELLLQMKQAGVYVDPFYFQRDARICRSVTDPARAAITLGQLAARYSDHRLLIFTDGDGFTDHYRREPAPWMEQFKVWGQRAVLTPEDPVHWQEREENLRLAGFTLVPANADGLEELGRWFNYGRVPTPERRALAPFPPSIVERPGRWMERKAPPHEDVDRLLTEIKKYLGDDGWRWLLACAVYPELTWDLTLYHGFALFGHEDYWLREWTSRLLRLARLPWFRQSWMPDWLRQELVDRLDGESGQAVRATIDRLLRSAIENPQQPVPLWYAQPARLSLEERLKLAWGWLKVRVSVVNADQEEPIRDYVFLNFMSGRRNRLGVSLPEVIRRLIYRDGLPALGVRSALTLALALFATVSVAYGLLAVTSRAEFNQAGLTEAVVTEPGQKRTEKIYKVDLGNNVFLEMIRIPTGEFLMGDDENGVAEYERECSRYDEKAKCKDWADDQAPQHQVKVNEFLLGRYEVTQQQWKAVMGELPSGMQDLEARFKGDALPVVRVSWDETQQFLKRLGSQYRLPSEAEWEYAARAGTTTAYAFGAEISPEMVNYHGDYPAGNQPKGLNRGAPIAVGSLRMNPWGLFDMHGNVWEWCQDHWHDNYDGAPSDSRPWINDDMAADRVIRGGSWNLSAVDCRSASRSWFAPGDRSNVVGFRLSRTLPSALLPSGRD